jgi:hypothetical protein
VLLSQRRGRLANLQHRQVTASRRYQRHHAGLPDILRESKARIPGYLHGTQWLPSRLARTTTDRIRGVAHSIRRWHLQRSGQCRAYADTEPRRRIVKPGSTKTLARTGDEPQRPSAGLCLQLGAMGDYPAAAVSDLSISTLGSTTCYNSGRRS